MKNVKIVELNVEDLLNGCGWEEEDLILDGKKIIKGYVGVDEDGFESYCIGVKLDSGEYYIMGVRIDRYCSYEDMIRLLKDF